jgi:hypothetical protein
MRNIALALIVMICLVMPARADVTNSAEINQIKKSLVVAVENSKVTDSLYLKLYPRKGKDAMTTAFVGTLEALKAKHAWNPYNKLKYVSMSNATMKQAVAASPQNIEIRFMRFSIQHYTPEFLGYSKNLNEDRIAIVNHYQNKTLGTDALLIKNIARFIIDSKRCTPTEVAVLKRYV